MLSSFTHLYSSQAVFVRHFRSKEKTIQIYRGERERKKQSDHTYKQDLH